jgi:hypothetical protein
MSEFPPLPVRLAHSALGRLRIRVQAPPGRGLLHHLAEELKAMPDTQIVHANRTARSVTVTYDPAVVSAPVLLQRLCTLGLIAVEGCNPAKLTEFFLAELEPGAHDPATFVGRLNNEMLTASAGRVDVFRALTGVLLLVAGIDAAISLARGVGVPWVRMLSFLLAAATTYCASDQPASTRAPSDSYTT